MEKVRLLPSRELTVEITTHCGARCIMCPRHEYGFAWEHMDMELFKDVLRQMVELEALSLNTCGFGDIFMDPRLEEKLMYVKKTHPFLKIFASSTGHLIDERKIHLLDYIDTLRISMYGTSKEVYESIHRGALKFEKVMGNIERIIALPKSKRPYLIMNFLVLPLNRHQVDEFKKYEHRVDEIMIWLPHTFVDTYRAQDGTKGPMKSCGRPFKGDFLVHVNGDVSVCCFDYNRKLLLGNVRGKSLSAILGGDELQRIRRVHEQCSFDGSDLICTKCDQLHDRSDALVYATNRVRRIGVLTSHPDLVIDVLDGQAH